MQIPHTKLSLAALHAVIEEFVTRDGTDHSPVEPRIEKVLKQLEAGTVVLHYDSDTQTCTIVKADSES